MQSTTPQSMTYFSTFSSVDFDIFLVSVKQELATFIINALYSALESSALTFDDSGSNDMSHLEMWFKAYRYVT